jgi:hypothetical protein
MPRYKKSRVLRYWLYLSNALDVEVVFVFVVVVVQTTQTALFFILFVYVLFLFFNRVNFVTCL